MNNSELIAEGLLRDPRIAKAKELLLETVKDYTQKINSVRPPNAVFKQSYDDLLKKFAQCRGAPLWFPFVGSGIGNGALVELLDGSIKYDFISGIGSHYFGHSNPKLIAANIDAAISDTVVQGNLQQNADSLELCSLLIQASKLPHCFLTTTGAMANENALKVALQKKYPANRILAFDKCFTGRTNTLSQITDKPSFREGLPLNIGVDYIPFYDHSRPEESTQLAISTLKRFIARYPKIHAVMILELVQGEGGFYPGSREFFIPLLKILKENDIAVLMDEVQTFGRTSELFAFQHFGLQEYVDICSVGKLSLACATLFNTEYKPKVGLLSQTFTASTSAIYSSKVVIETLLDGNFFGLNGINSKVHDHFVRKLEEIAKKYPTLIKGPYGIGAMIAFTPYDGDTQKATQFVHKLFEAGVLSFIAGSNPTRVRFLPPVGVITEDDIDKGLKIVEETLVQNA